MNIDDTSRVSLLLKQEYPGKESLESGEFYHDRDSREERGRRPNRWSYSIILLSLSNAVFLVALIYVLSISKINLGRSFSREDLPTYTPLRDAIRYETRTVGYNFEDINPFKGGSVADIDQQWDSIINGAREVRLTKKQMAQANISSIMLADGSDDYIVQPVAYHMLHCLYNLYKYVHPDFYGEDPSGPAWVVKHTDHCVDNLRQFVQCHAGTGLSTFKWLDSRKLPYPILNTEETCVNWVHYDSWVREHSVDMDDIRTLKNGHLLVHPTFGPVYKEDYQPKSSKVDHEHQHDGEF